MNQCSIIGNLTHEPEMKKTQSDIPVCTFTVAVNRRKRGDNEQGDADFFRVSAWRNLGESCAKYLHKGKKVYVSGTISARAYTANDGQARVSLELNAQDVEFLSPYDGPKQGAQDSASASAPVVVSNEPLPF